MTNNPNNDQNGVRAYRLAQVETDLREERNRNEERHRELKQLITDGFRKSEALHVRDHTEHELRIRRLENSQARTGGIAAILGAIGGALLAWISRYVQGGG